MGGSFDHPYLLVLLLGAVPVTIVTVAVVVAVLALTARRPSTRRHCIEIMRTLTGFIRAIRGAR